MAGRKERIMIDKNTRHNFTKTENFNLNLFCPHSFAVEMCPRWRSEPRRLGQCGQVWFYEKQVSRRKTCIDGCRWRSYICSSFSSTYSASSKSSAMCTCKIEEKKLTGEGTCYVIVFRRWKQQESKNKFHVVRWYGLVLTYNPNTLLPQLHK